MEYQSISPLINERLEIVLAYCMSDRIRPPKYSEKVVRSKKNSSANHRKKYPEREKARQLAKLLPIQPCIVCNSTSNIQRHHHNYNKPLDITYLCHAHHREIHSYDSIAV